MIDAVVAGVVAGGVISALILILSGMYAVIVWRDKRKFLAIKKERTAALQVYGMVMRNVPGDLHLPEYNQALKDAMRKYHLGDQGRITFAGSDKQYLAELITETVLQNRLSKGTYEIAKADSELDKSDNQNKEEFTA